MHGFQHSRWAALALLLTSFPARGEDLLDLYSRARQYDPAFQAARYEKETALASLRESRAGVLPTLSADVEASRTDQDVDSSIPFEESFHSERYTISITQPIYRSDRLARISQAKAGVRQADSEFLAAEQDLIYRLAQAHFNHLAARDRLEFAVAERTAIGEQLAETEERLGSGLATITDVHDARARFALAQAGEIEAVGDLDESLRALEEITGAFPESLRHLSEAFPLVEPERPDVEVWVEAALFQNPRIQARQAAVEVAEGEVRRQVGTRLPALDFVAVYRMNEPGGSTPEDLLGSDSRSANLFLRLGIPIFDGGRTSALARGATLQRQVAEQNLEAERRRVDRETRSAFRGVLSGIDQVEALAKSLFSHEAALSAREEGLRSGVRTGRDVLDARQELFSAKRDLARERYLYILNSVRLEQAVGTLDEVDLREINDYLQ